MKYITLLSLLFVTLDTVFVVVVAFVVDSVFYVRPFLLLIFISLETFVLVLSAGSLLSLLFVLL